jgi:hypothetical protein
MATVRDPKTGRIALVQQCRVCHKPLYFGYTKLGKRCPYDITDEGEPTEISHFTTCARVKDWNAGVRE